MTTTDNAEAEKSAASPPTTERADAGDEEREATGLPGRPMALLLAVGLALLAALIAWAAVGLLPGR